MRFFEPNPTLIKSIIKHAGNRLIVDLGCGPHANVLQELVAEGASKVIGCDMFLDSHHTMKRLKSFDSEASIHLFPGSIDDNLSMLTAISKHPAGTLFLLCRPCHAPELIDGAINLALNGNQEILYIGLPKNLDLDLSDYNYEQIYLDGTSKENEIILKIISRK